MVLFELLAAKLTLLLPQTTRRGTLQKVTACHAAAQTRVHIELVVPRELARALRLHTSPPALQTLSHALAGRAQTPGAKGDTSIPPLVVEAGSWKDRVVLAARRTRLAVLELNLLEKFMRTLIETPTSTACCAKL
jgi:hypothetical protein